MSLEGAVAPQVREVLRWPHAALCTPCAPVGRIDDAVRGLAADMLATMYAAPGRGLAAPQVGVLLRLFVMDAGWKDGAPDPQVMINPAVVRASREMATHDEGCLSIPGVLAAVTRPARVGLAWTDPAGASREADFDGVAAVIVQHELDHLEGIVTFDRLTGAARAAAVAAYGR